MNSGNLEEMAVALAAVIILSMAYAKGIAGTQYYISEALVKGAKVPSRYRMLLNMGVGVVLGLVVTLICAMWVQTLEVVPAGLLAGLLAATESSKLHDQKSDQEKAEAVQPRRFPR